MVQPAKAKKTEAEVRARLKELEHEYEHEIVKMGLIKGLNSVLATIIALILTIIASLIPIIFVGREFMSGTHVVIIVALVIVGVLGYFFLLFGRVGRLRAEITSTKKLLEIVQGQKENDE